MSRPIKGVTLIYVVTAALMLLCGVFSLGTFPALSIGAILLTALMVTASSWLIYCLIGWVVCVALSIERPGFAFPTVLGTVSGAAGIALIGCFFPGLVISHGWLAAVPFAFANTMTIWGTSIAIGFVGTKQSFWPVRR